MAFNIMILYLADNVLRQVNDIESAPELWKKLDKLYLSKSLTNKILLKERFFGYRMESSKTVEENLNEFNKICLDLTNSGEKIESENQPIILLNSLPEIYKEIKNAIKYGRDSLTLDTVIDALRSKNLELKSEKRENEALSIGGKFDSRNHQNRYKKNYHESQT